MATKDFFISRNKADREWAKWIAWQLEEAQYTVVLQDWDFRPGMNFALEMKQAAAECDRTIAVLSPDYITAEYSQGEWAAAFAADPTGKNRKLIPVRVRECELKGLDAPIIYIAVASPPRVGVVHAARLIPLLGVVAVGEHAGGKHHLPE